MVTYRGAGPERYALYCVAFSPDGTSIASAGDDNTVHIWNATTGGTIFVYGEHGIYVNSLAWSPDGTRIVSADDNASVQVWQA